MAKVICITTGRPNNPDPDYPRIQPEYAALKQDIKSILHVRHGDMFADSSSFSSCNGRLQSDYRKNHEGLLLTCFFCDKCGMVSAWMDPVLHDRLMDAIVYGTEDEDEDGAHDEQNRAIFDMENL